MIAEQPIPKHEPSKKAGEKLLLIVLAAIQFTVIVDFLIIMPLGPQYMRVFGITPGQFGLIVSSYAISAGISGLVAGFILDRYDRRRALLWLYAGFTIGTLCCALAPSYYLLIAARAVAGAFGGVAGALILAVIGDAIPEQRRGAAIGLVMSSFSVASICGVPLGLLLATNLNWHIPFLVLAALSGLVWLGAARALPSMRGHMHHASSDSEASRMAALLKEPHHQAAFLFMAVLTITGFIIFPYISNYLVGNVGVTEKQLPLIYLFGGLSTFFTMNWIGRWADRAGKPYVFTRMSLLATIPILLVTNLPPVPLAVAIGVSTLLMVCMSGRMVPAMAMMTASVEARYRGGFMSLNSSVQQFSSGVAAFVSGQILGQLPGGQLTHFPVVGGISLCLALVCLGLAKFLRPAAATVSSPAVAAEA